MEEWKESIIEQTSIQMIDGDRGKNYPKNSDFFSEGYCLFLNAGNVTKSGFSFADNSFITEDKDQLLRKGRLERNDVVITTRGTVGNVALYDSSVPYEHVRINSGMLILKGGRDILPEYLYYFLKGSRFQTQIAQFVSGSAQPQLPKSTLGKMKISFPVELNVQKRICGVLKSIDDKIEINRRINDNLEQQALALFKSWFVDFEPFRDQPFVESELGMIPEGWRVGTLSEVANITMGASPSGSSYNVNGEGTVFYQGRAEFGYRFPHRNMFTTEPKRYAEEGEVLLSVRAPVGDTNIANERCCIGRGLAAIGSKCYPSYILYLVKSLKSVFEQYNGEGTVFGSINKKTLEGLRIIVPEIKYIERFEKVANPLDGQIRCKEEESRRLASLRDTLLPRLMSGEIKVEDVTL